MQKIILAIISILVILSGCWLLLHKSASQARSDAMQTPGTGTAASTTAPQAEDDLLPLYSAVSWSPLAPQSVVFGTTTYTGVGATSATTTNTMGPSDTFMPFEEYYAVKLPALGWSVANDLAAGGHTGGVTGYRKGDAILLTSYGIVYHTNRPDEPSACPCDVTLSVFKGAAE
jgi:hypothetical protein